MGFLIIDSSDDERHNCERDDRPDKGSENKLDHAFTPFASFRRVQVIEFKLFSFLERLDGHFLRQNVLRVRTRDNSGSEVLARNVDRVVDGGRHPERASVYGLSDRKPVEQPAHHGVRLEQARQAFLRVRSVGR